MCICEFFQLVVRFVKYVFTFELKHGLRFIVRLWFALNLGNVHDSEHLDGDAIEAWFVSNGLEI